MCLSGRMLALEWKGRALIEKVNSRCFSWSAAAILVDQNCPPICRPHTKLYKGGWNVSANNSEIVGHKDQSFGKTVNILVFYNISISWLNFLCVTVKTMKLYFSHLRARLRLVPHFSSGIVERAKRFRVECITFLRFFHAASLSRGPRTTFAGQGPSKAVAFFRIPNKISMSGTWNFRIIERNIKAIFREYFSSLREDSGKIFKLITFRRGPRTTYCISLTMHDRYTSNVRSREVKTNLPWPSIKFATCEMPQRF